MPREEPSPNAPTEHKELQRRRILEAAIAVFSWKGYVSSTITEIAHQAGLSHGLVHHYFPSKADLFSAAIAEGIGCLQSLRQAAFAGPESPETRLRRWAFRQSQMQDQAFLYSRLVMQVLGAPGMHPADCLERLLGFMQEETQAVARLLEEAGQPQADALERAEFALSVLFGHLLLRLWHADPEIQRECGQGLYRRTCTVLQVSHLPVPDDSGLPSCPSLLQVADTGWDTLIRRVHVPAEPSGPGHEGGEP